MWMLTCLFTQTNFWLRLRNSLSRQYYLDVSLSNNRLLFSLGIRLSLSTCKLLGLSSFSLLILLFSIFQHSRAVLRLKLFFFAPYMLLGDSEYSGLLIRGFGELAWRACWQFCSVICLHSKWT